MKTMDLFSEDLRPPEERLWGMALTESLNTGLTAEWLHYWRTLPPPSQVADRDFLSEGIWAILNAGMKEALIRKKWPSIENAFLGFDAAAIVADAEGCYERGLAIIRHPGKMGAAVEMARVVAEKSPIRNYLATLNEKELLDFLGSLPFIGKVTRFHLARNIGVDVTKPDIHLTRITAAAGYASPDALVTAMCSLNGERKGVTDFVLWYWAAHVGRVVYARTAEIFGRQYVEGDVG